MLNSKVIFSKASEAGIILFNTLQNRLIRSNANYKTFEYVFLAKIFFLDFILAVIL